MQNYKIPRTEILKLYESSLNEISPHSIGQWLKSKTDEKYVVVPVFSIEIFPEKMQKSLDVIKKTELELQDLIKNYDDIFKQWL